MASEAVGKYDTTTKYATIEYKINRIYLDEVFGFTAGSIDTYGIYICHKPYDDGGTYSGIIGDKRPSISDIKYKNLNREFTAVGYVKVTNGASVQYYYIVREWIYIQDIERN